MVSRTLHHHVPRRFGPERRDQDKAALTVDPGVDGKQVAMLAVQMGFAEVDTCRHARHSGRLGTELLR